MVRLNVVTWNVLAHAHTHYFDRVFAQPGRESETHMLARHTANAAAIARLQPDVLFLQEADEHFLPLGWSGGKLPCGVDIGDYECVQSYDKTTEKAGRVLEGVAVLLRRGRVALTDVPPVKLRKSEARGWKCGLVVFARTLGDEEKNLSLVNVHLPYDHADLDRHAFCLNNACAHLPSPPQPTILAGDCNAVLSEFSSKLAPVLAQHGLGALVLPALAPTALDDSLGFDPARQIDYVCVGAGVRAVEGCEVGRLSESGVGPYADANDDDGSDHAWVRVLCEL